MSKQTAIQWLEQEFIALQNYGVNELGLITKAKEMENKRAQEYAEFAIRCDRKGMKILNFEDWIKL